MDLFPRPLPYRGRGDLLVTIWQVVERGGDGKMVPPPGPPILGEYATNVG
jgi:hypothetical protein